MDGLGYGSVIALLMRSRREKPALWLGRERAFDIAAIVLPVCTIVLWIYLHGDRSRLMLSTVALVMADASLALIAFAILRKSGGRGWWLRALRARWLRSIGMVSYSLYLFHYPLSFLVHTWVLTWGLSRHGAAITQTLLSIVVSFAVAYGLWYGMESKILNWKDRHVPSPAHP
jgi:peptidoglycan/LPS O-acetylase OafA/YrhL